MAMSGREIVGVILLLLGTGLFLGAAILFARARSASRWASAEGRITSSRLEGDTTTDGSGLTQMFRLHLTYEYEVGGRKLLGKRREFGESMFGWMRSHDLMRRLQESYPEGRVVTVYYDPGHPERCTLSRTVDDARFRQLLVVAAIIAAFGVGALTGYVHVEKE